MKSLYKTLLLGAFFLTTVDVARAQVIQNPDQRRTISVSGESIVKVIPDMATIRFGVVTEHDNPEEARRLNAEASAKVMNAVRALGVSDRKMRLELLQLEPRREYNPQTQEWKDLGYQATRNVVVEVEDLEKLPELVARVVQEGANRLNGIEYDVKDKDTARNEALQKAVRNARDKAQNLAGALDVNISSVLHIQEQSFDFPRPYMREMNAAVAMSKADVAAEPEAYSAGEIEVRATVQVVFEIK